MLAAYCYASIAAAAAVAVGRVSGRGRWAPLLAAEAATPFVFVGTSIALAASLVGRLRWAALVTAGLAGTQLSWIAPAVTGRRQATGGRGDLRLLSANLLYGNAGTAAWADRLRVERPDVVLLIEASPTNVAPLERSGALDDYPHRHLFLRPNAFGFALFSRFALADVHLEAVHDRDMLSARVIVGDHTVQLLGVHTRAPVRSRAVAWQSELAAIAAGGSTVARSTVADRLVIAGDFNATRDHAPFRRLCTTAGVSDAHDEVGAGLRGTWPADRRFPPLFRLDHILVSRDVRVAGATTGPIPGSDHRWIQADLCL